MEAALKAIILESESAKRQGDAAYANNELTEAVTHYDTALTRLAVLKGSSFGELQEIRVLASKAQCLIKLDDFENAISTCDVALANPSVTSDSQLWCKVLLRKAQALQSLLQFESALLALDSAIALGAQCPENLMELREKIIEKSASSTPFTIPPVPRPLTREVIHGAIVHILSTSGSPEDILDPLRRTAVLRGNLDARDDKNKNIMWALCKAALIRAESPQNDPDAILPILQLLIEFGAKAEQRYDDQGHRTPLQMFAISGAVECARLLLDRGASVTTYDDEGWSPLVVACAPSGPFSGRNSAMVRLLLDKNANPNHATGDGMTPIALAAQCNDLVSVRLLLAAGAQINKRCKFGFSPIIWALIGSSGQMNESAQFLLAAASQRGKQIFKECDQDARCYRLSRLFGILREAKVKQLQRRVATSVEGDDSTNSTPEEDLEIVTKLLAYIPMDKAKIPAEIPSEGTETVEDVSASRCMLEKIYFAYQEIVPDLFEKRWGVPPIGDDVPLAALTPANLMNGAVAISSPVEKAQLRVLMTAVYGPGGRPDKPPFLMPFELATNPAPIEREFSLEVARRSLFVSGLYPDFRDLVHELISRRFSAAIPSEKVLEFIVSQIFGATTTTDDSESDPLLLTQVVFDQLSGESEYKSYWADLLNGHGVEMSFLNPLLGDSLVDSTGMKNPLLVVMPDLFYYLRRYHKDKPSAQFQDTLSTACNTLGELFARAEHPWVVMIGECKPTSSFAGAMPDLVDPSEVELGVDSKLPPEEPPSDESPFHSFLGERYDDMITRLGDSYEIVGREMLDNWMWERNEVILWKRN